MKRALLIAGGTVGGLGAVLVITPPNLSKTAPIAVDTAPRNHLRVSGSVANTRYGPVQVKIMVKNGKIVDAQAVQAPTGSSDRYTQMSVPVLRQQQLLRNLRMCRVYLVHPLLHTVGMNLLYLRLHKLVYKFSYAPAPHNRCLGHKALL
jgi:hypothetical protein